MGILEDKISQLPLSPGVYIMRDKSGNIIYIGKAVVLKNRVKQYFSNSKKHIKVQAMVDNIASFDYIITLTEKDALSLEANLVKKHKPHYNILLKDDKAFPYIRIDLSEPFPTIEVTRKLKKDGAKYFGPYFNGVSVYDIVGIIRSCYKMRTCPKKFNKNTRECLNYHIDLCYAPCRGHISREEYNEVVSKVVMFLSGREDTAQRLIKQKMLDASENEAFERAIEYRYQLSILENLKQKKLLSLTKNEDIDSFFYYANGDHSVVSVAIVRASKLMGVRNFFITDLAEDFDEIMTSFITQYYGENNQLPDEICLQTEFDCSTLKDYLSAESSKNVSITFPKIGTKAKLLEMANVNAADFIEKNIDKEVRHYEMTIGALKKLQEIFSIPSLRRIECYDISNISGVDKVASGVTFIDGEPSKSDYRRYKIKTVEGANDFACLSEVVGRRLTRAKNGDEKFTELPNLIVIDGGKGQLSAAYASLCAAGFDIPMISLAEREEEIYLPFESRPILLQKESLALKLLIRLRDEAHRFAITYHRNLRSNRLDSALDKIPGVGKVKRKKLLAAFSNFAGLKAASAETLSSIPGIDKTTAQNVANFFESERSKKTDDKT